MLLLGGAEKLSGIVAEYKMIVLKQSGVVFIELACDDVIRRGGEGAYLC